VTPWPNRQRKVDDRHHHAAKIEDTANIVGLPWQMRHGRPALDFPDCDNFNTVLVFTNRKADEFDLAFGGR
jgi:hypothetical protein